MFIQGATFIPDSRVLGSKVIHFWVLEKLLLQLFLAVTNFSFSGVSQIHFYKEHISPVQCFEGTNWLLMIKVSLLIFSQLTLA